MTPEEIDLRTVIRWIQRREKHNKPHRSLQFRSFISGPGSLDYFEEDLAEARREIRIAKKPRPEPARDSILRQTGREIETAKVQTPAEMEFIKKCKEAAGL